MVIGKGMLAQKFIDEFGNLSDTLVFASGVSNSKTYEPSQFEREENLLAGSIRQFNAMRIVYFSTCSIYDPSQEGTPYILHKTSMERLIMNHAKTYLICRTTNIVGHKGNSNTIINYLADKIQSGAEFECWSKAVRNILDIDDLYKVVKAILQRLRPLESRTVNVFNPVSYNTREIISMIERHFRRHGNFSTLDKGAAFSIPDTYGLDTLYSELELRFTDEYIATVLNKYHPVSIPQE